MQSTFHGTGKAHPYQTASFLSKCTFWWTRSIFSLGNKRDLYESDLTVPLNSHKSSKLGEEYAAEWDKECDRAKLKHGKKC